MKEKTILKVENLTVKDPESKKTILKNINFSVKKNSIHLLLGKNGSGKTTLALTIFGLKNFLIEGKIYFQGKLLNNLLPEKRAKLGLGMVFQNLCFFEGITLREYFSIFKKSEKEILKAMKLVGLPSNFLERTIDAKLSAGERKKIEIVSVILQKPKLIILDEAESGLDLPSYWAFLDLVLKIKEKTKATIIFITHRTSAWKISQEATLIDKGEIIYSGNVKEAIKKYFELQKIKPICPKLIS